MSDNGRAPVRLLLTVEEAAEALTISRWKVFELIRTRQLRSIKIGGLRRVPRAAIDEYIVRLLVEAG
jgi:excisionase family DNA binding protein